MRNGTAVEAAAATAAAASTAAAAVAVKLCVRNRSQNFVCEVLGTKLHAKWHTIRNLHI